MTALFASITSSASARVDWRLERYSEGAGKELIAGVAIIALIILFNLYIKLFSYTKCDGCGKKMRGKAKRCSECGLELPTYP
jgi:hypothetical protein